MVHVCDYLLHAGRPDLGRQRDFTDLGVMWKAAWKATYRGLDWSRDPDRPVLWKL